MCFLNYVYFRLPSGYANGKNYLGTTIYRKTQAFLFCLVFLNLETQCAKQIFNLKNEQRQVFLCIF